ncbi:LAME_0A07822g1_1 [Lachancea meyersii CBS 8951]|uniref:LAME_0A07822g1_1 n=1 Tax=Lachancea meyersii CBS 8951 TaxID=1266667 RepID=A0A1G4IR09_9SACH|nr:LAME_0A07822g1_1 [Lachancea meyersii CBS 8951]
MLSVPFKRLAKRSLTNYRPLFKNVPKYDDAELMAGKLNKASYVSKRGKDSYQWVERSAQEMETEHNEKMARMMKLRAALQGILLVAGVGVAYTAYMQWPQIQGWWLAENSKLDDNAIELLVKQKEKRRQVEFPKIPPTESPSTVPGVYYWGLGRNDNRNSKFPLRVSHFDNQTLRDVWLSPENGNLAVSDKGDLYVWDTNSKTLILPDQDIIVAKASNGVAYAQTKKGDILIVPLADEKERNRLLCMKRSWLLPWKKYCQYDFKLDTKSAFSGRSENKVRQFDVGKDHLVFLSNAGKAYTCATGIREQNGAKSRGQFGVPSLSQFDPFPKCNKVYDIELLNHNTVGNGGSARTIEKIACGNYHSLALDSVGEVYSFGLNTHGQLGQPVSYDMEYIPYPKRIVGFNAHFPRDTYLKCVDIKAGGDTSFVSVVPQDIHKFFRNKGNVSLQENLDKITYFAFGGGISGELGNGNFKHCQQEPTKLKVVNDIVENGSIAVQRPAKIEKWSCGSDHCFTELENHEIVAWGSNSQGQLGNGKKIKSCKPVKIPEILEPDNEVGSTHDQMQKHLSSTLRLLPGQTIVAGEKSSCIYWEA